MVQSPMAGTLASVKCARGKWIHDTWNKCGHFFLNKRKCNRNDNNSNNKSNNNICGYITFAMLRMFWPLFWWASMIFIGPNHYHMSPVVLSDYFIMSITYIYIVDHDIHNYASYVHLHVVMKSFFRFQSTYMEWWIWYDIMQRNFADDIFTFIFQYGNVCIWF